MQTAGRLPASGRSGKALGPIPLLLIALVFSVLGLMQFYQNQKWLVLICCLLSAALSVFALLRKRREVSASPFLLLFAAYLLWMGISLMWAASGKFFLREYSKQLFALPLVLFILLYLPRRESAVRKLLFVLSAAGAVYALFSVDLASAGLSTAFFSQLPGFTSAMVGFESGTRLTGIFANANISAGLLGLCIYLSLYLLCSAETRAERAISAVFASFQATTFLLNFSLGATGFFLAGVVVYLLCAGKDRTAALLHMLAVALPSLAAVFLSFPFFASSGAGQAVPLAGILGAAALTVFLVLLPLPRLYGRLENRARLTNIVLILLVLLLGAYAAAGSLLEGASRLSAGQTLRRSAYPKAGSYRLQADAEGAFSLRVESQDDREVVIHSETLLYAGPGQDVSFTVPEGSRVVYVTFRAEEDTLLRSAVLDGEEDYALHLGYPLLPGFIANRLQGLRANENAIQRAAFFRDGIKVFRDHPLLGAGLGSFESLIYGYQSFHYDTKYVHNHYIQVLLDAGIVGFLLYLSLLVLTLVLLLRGFRAETPYRRLYPALCAAFCLLLLHSVMEVVMSTSVYLLYGYALLAVTDLCFGRPAKKLPSLQLGSGITGALSLVYAILIVLNMQASAAVNRASTASQLFGALEKARKTDVFDRNDWMVSFIINCAKAGANAYLPQADLYAQQLLEVPSNSLHQYLVQYHLAFRDYDKALQAARKGAGFNYSDNVTWNCFFAAFADALDRYPEDRDRILDAVAVLNGDLQKAQEKLLDSTILDEVSQSVIAQAGDR